MSSALQRRVTLLEQDSPGDDLQAELAAARKYYADPAILLMPSAWQPLPAMASGKAP
jgi:hypothetical protein